MRLIFYWVSCRKILEVKPTVQLLLSPVVGQGSLVFGFPLSARSVAITESLIELWQRIAPSNLHQEYLLALVDFTSDLSS